MGYSVDAAWDPETEETTEAYREPIVVLLSDDGDQMHVRSSDDDTLILHHIGP